MKPLNMQTKSQPRYTGNILFQMFAVFLLLGITVFWQQDVIYQIYLGNQINAIGWAVNGGIGLLFFLGLMGLLRRFFECRREEISIARFLINIKDRDDPILGVHPKSMMVERYLTLQEFSRQRASINQSALAATLLAAQSSRNSFLKFVHNVLILVGVFGTVVSLSFSLLGASEMISGNAQANGLGVMFFGMSTALSTTMSAILAYLIFGYFYIRLTDVQTWIISQIETVTTTTLLPHLQISQEALVKEYTDSIQTASQLIERLDQSQQQHTDSLQTLQEATRLLSAQLVASQKQDTGISSEELLAKLAELGQLQTQSLTESREQLSKVIALLQQGFRLDK